MRKRKSYLANQQIIFHQLFRRFKNLPRPLQFAFTLSLGTSALIYASVMLWYFSNDLTNPTFLGMDKCNACYGKKLCRSFLRGDFVLKGVSGVRVFDHVNIQNVFYAVANNSIPVVLKKLAHNSEFRDIDTKICTLSGLRYNCDLDLALSRSKPYNEPQLTTYSLENYFTRSMPCMSQRLLDYLQQHYDDDLTDFRVYKDARKRFIYTFSVNPEPLIIKAFPYTKGYPFPKAYGACGRYLVTENAGTRLADYYNAHWIKRIDIAWQLMKIADKFTKGSSENFKFYWTDCSYENIFINNKGKVVIVDLEDIIIIDTAKIEREKKAGDFDTKYSLKFTECKSGYGDCVEYSTESLCTQKEADLNYYVICRNLLSSYANHHLKPRGFLHDLPSNIEQEYKIKGLLEDCANPTKPNERWIIKDKILQVLKEIKDKHV
ncbi:DgyrCDS13897 [Dimorphilus gyrociliatus]|uniref:DgyrCDS13897 n=1 Tax=Dimorphilus gyrociliatus TaxID=2664684 RepID=A0A7I8WC64_9ANNE|nr:DgyrCDS13897 [Dimorphilus gyrociliatus]